MSLSIVNRVTTLPNTEIGLTEGTVLTGQDLSSISTKTVTEIKHRIAGELILSRDDIRAILEVLQYEGFDPDVVYRHLAFKRAKNGKSWNQVKQDVQMLLTIQHTKGNVSSKNMKSLKNEGKQLVAGLFKEWDIVSTRSASKRNAVTLPRLAAAFPFQSAQIAAEAPRDFSGFCDSSKLPACMKSSSFPSLIPRGEKCSLLLNIAYNAFATDQSVNLGKRNYYEMKTEDRKNLFQEQQKFSDISFSSPVMDEDHRKFAVVYLGLGTADVYRALMSCITYSRVDLATICSEIEYVANFREFVTAHLQVSESIKQNALAIKKAEEDEEKKRQDALAKEVDRLAKAAAAAAAAKAEEEAANQSSSNDVGPI